MADSGSGVTITDGSLDFSGGIDSISVTSIATPKNPNGLRRNQLAWLVNATVRDGGITQRLGWQPLGTMFKSSSLYQGGFMYQPDAAFPYLVLNINGHTFQVLLDNAGQPTELSTGATLMPATQPQFNYVQGENFLIIQAGDGVTLPLFWDGANLRRSKGITNPAVAPGTPGVNEIPAATAMDYFMGQIWYAQGRSYSAGDIVGGPSGAGTPANRGSILEVTESPLVLGGNGFTVPVSAGNIRALFHNANINSLLGQGNLLIGTRNAIFSLQVPTDRTQWIATTVNNFPQQTIAQLFYGPVNDRCVTLINGDVFYQALEPSIRSLFASQRDFQQWGNVAVSAPMERVLSFQNRALMNFVSGINWDNRLWQTLLPAQTPQGVIHQAIGILDFTPISEFGSSQQPAWEGIYQGLNILQLFTGDFGGRQRSFAVVLQQDNTIGLWEMTDSNRFENGDNRVTWVVEFPAYNFGEEFLLKRLVSAELWLDKLFGETTFQMDWRPDGDPCYQPWFQWKLCSARNSCEDLINPTCYPLTPFREGFRQTITLPKPKPNCETSSGRPADIGYQFQCRLTIHGWVRVRGLLLHAIQHEKKLYQNMVC